ncbi:MAG TPA: antitoxin [Actinomycetota bacterium]|nr:antitoxin [Actinomycetota bacterium]
MLERRLQILLDEARYQRVTAEARHRGVSVGSVVREAIDRALPATGPQRRAAAERILSAPDMPVHDDPSELRTELDELRGRRG